MFSTTSRVLRKPLVSIHQRSLTSLTGRGDQLNPTQFHQYLKCNKLNNELKEFLADESEMLATESFHLQQQPQKVNSEFAKQIHDLLQPTYGSEKTA